METQGKDPPFTSHEGVVLIIDGKKSNQPGLLFKFADGLQIETSNLKMQDQEVRDMGTTAIKLFEVQARLESLHKISPLFADLRKKVSAIRSSDVNDASLIFGTSQLGQAFGKAMKAELDIFFKLFDELRAHHITFVRLGEREETNGMYISTEGRAFYEAFINVYSQSVATIVVGHKDQ